MTNRATSEKSGSEGRHVEASVSPGRDGEAAQTISLLELANALLKRWKLVTTLPLAAAFLTGVITLFIPAKYTATATFVPETPSEVPRLQGGLASLALQFGVGSQAGVNSPAFYGDILYSRTLRDQVLRAPFSDYRTAVPEDSVRLLDMLDVAGGTEAERLEAGRKILEESMSVSVDNETSIVSVSVETFYPALSADVANRFVQLLNRFNLETRQSHALESRRFVEERLAQAERELRDSEGELERFLEQNRQFDGSPQLTFQYERLQRQLRVKEGVFTSLRQEYEAARIQEVNDMPVITVIDHAVPPQKRSSPRRTVTVMLSLVLAGTVGILYAFGREYVERAQRQEHEALEEFISRCAAVKRQVLSTLAWTRGQRPT